METVINHLRQWLNKCFEEDLKKEIKEAIETLETKQERKEHQKKYGHVFDNQVE